MELGTEVLSCPRASQGVWTWTEVFVFKYHVSTPSKHTRVRTHARTHTHTLWLQTDGQKDLVRPAQLSWGGSGCVARQGGSTPTSGLTFISQTICAPWARGRSLQAVEDIVPS